MKNLCILDRPHRSWIENDYILKDFNDIVFEETYKNVITDLYMKCCEVGLIYPNIKIYNNIDRDFYASLRYDYGNYYVGFLINIDNNKSIINFVYGTLNKEPKKGILTDKDKQLQMFSKFLYRDIPKILV
jgi:hypothetical protein